MFNHFNTYLLYPLLERAQKRKIVAKYKQLISWDKIPFTQRREEIKKLLFQIVNLSKNEVPYYKELFKRTGFDPNKILKDTRYLEDLPVLTKDIILEQGSRMFRNENFQGLHPRKTGGSTGKSVVFYYDNESLDWTAAAHLYAISLTGKKRTHLETHLSGDINDTHQLSFKDTIVDKLKLASMNRTKLMVSGFSEYKLKNYLDQLKRERPYLVQGHPSTMYAIATFVISNNLPRVKVCDVFEPSGEGLNDKMVKSIEDALGCKVFNRYGNAEFGVMAHSLESGDYKSLKVFDKLVHLETYSSGEILSTGLFNFSMPLIRYNTGDLGRIIQSEDGIFLHDLEGRVHDQVAINGNIYPTHFIMDYLDHMVGGIVEFQILVENGNPPLLRVVPANYDDSLRIKELVLKKWPSGLGVEFIKHEQLIQVGWRGKFRHVVSNRH